MKVLTKITFTILPRWLRSFLATVIAIGFTHNAYAIDLAQSPLFLTGTVKPNIMLVLDNSYSMDADIIIPAGGTPFDSAINYLSTAQCAINTLPTEITTNRVRDRSYTTQSSCEAQPNHEWSFRRGGRCYFSATTTTANYGTSIPSDFFGYFTNNTWGTSCFDSNTTYTTSLALPAGIVTPVQISNYLNWYYSNQINSVAHTSKRLEVAKNSAIALVDSLPSEVRLGFSIFNSDNGGDLLEVVDDLVEDKKTNIKNRITATIANASTPLAETMVHIGRYFSEGSTNVILHSGEASASTEPASSVLPDNLHDGTNWGGRLTISNEPSFGGSPVEYSCQKSFAVLLTDGLPSNDRDISSNNYLKNYDNDCGGSLCSTYDMKNAYNYPGNGLTGAGPNSSDYFDDVTQALYEMDLRPDLRNVDESDTAKNNITTYVVGFADDNINPNVPGVNPLPKDAAEQGGGEYFYAGNEAELTASLISTFNFILEQNASSSSVATNSTQFQSDSLIYQALFNSSDWSGDLVAYTLETEDINDNGELDPGEDLNGNGRIDVGIIGSSAWSAADIMPTADNRTIYSYDPDASPKGIEFLWSNLSNNQQTILGSEAVLNYLRGDQSGEILNGGSFRNRSSILGDIINSDPLYVEHNDLGYSSLSGIEGSSYNSFISTTRAELLYVAANDGILHAFDAVDGEEMFAYIPNATFLAVSLLTDPNYHHQYILDGSPQSGDVYYNSAWHTVLVGGLGAGGKALFALDITDPDNFSATNILWEFTDVDDADLGFTLSEANIVRLASGDWVAIVGNGYNSTAGTATLYIINVQTGDLIKKITVEDGGDNGLSSSVTADVNNDGIVDYVYAGDLKGNLWKFDLTDNDPSNWTAAYSGAPLFVATDTNDTAQPITAKPAISKAAAVGQNSGIMIYFGTGKYLENSDASDVTSKHTFYAIWDRCDTSICGSGVVSGRGELQQQSIIYEGDSGITGADLDIRLTTNCEVSYGNTVPTTSVAPCTTETNRSGWYIDLLPPSSVPQGERVVSNPILRHGAVIFPTLIPTPEICTPGGTSWLMEINQFSGARLAPSPFDVNGDGLIDANDLVTIIVNGAEITTSVSGLKSNVGIISTPAVISCGPGIDCKFAAGSSGNIIRVIERAPVGARRSWRQIFTD